MSMAGASKGNHGGFVEKAQAELDRTAADVAEALAYAQGHPELAAQPGAATPEAFRKRAFAKVTERLA